MTNHLVLESCVPLLQPAFVSVGHSVALEHLGYPNMTRATPKSLRIFAGIRLISTLLHSSASATKVKRGGGLTAT